MVPPRLSLMPQRAVINDNQPRAGAEEPAQDRRAALCAYALAADVRASPAVADPRGAAVRRRRAAGRGLAGALKEGGDVGALLIELQAWYAERGINLVRVAGKWTSHGRGPVLRSGASCDRGAPPLEGRARDAGDHRLSPAGHARRDRGDPRRVDLCRHARHPARDARCGRGRRRAPAGRSRMVRQRSSSATSGSTASRTSPVSPSSRAPVFSTATCRRASPCLSRATLPRSCRTSWRSRRRGAGEVRAGVGGGRGAHRRSRSPADGGREK